MRAFVESFTEPASDRPSAPQRLASENSPAGGRPGSKSHRMPQQHPSRKRATRASRCALPTQRSACFYPCSHFTPYEQRNLVRDSFTWERIRSSPGLRKDGEASLAMLRRRWLDISYERTAYGRMPGSRSSASLKVRPSAGRSRNAENAHPETHWTHAFSIP
jgi:hypothetical protein